MKHMRVNRRITAAIVATGLATSLATTPSYVAQAADTGSSDISTSSEGLFDSGNKGEDSEPMQALITMATIGLVLEGIGILIGPAPAFIKHILGIR